MNHEELKAYRAEQMKILLRQMDEADERNDPIEGLKREFIRALSHIRLDQGVTQAELAARSGLNRSVIARIESHHGNPSLKTLIRIAEAIDAKIVPQAQLRLRSVKIKPWKEPS